MTKQIERDLNKIDGISDHAKDSGSSTWLTATQD